MKFIDEKGEIVEGTPISEELIFLREKVTAYMHETVCANKYHASYSGKPACEISGNRLAAVLDAFNGEGRLGQLIAKEVEPVKEEVEA